MRWTGWVLLAAMALPRAVGADEIDDIFKEMDRSFPFGVTKQKYNQMFSRAGDLLGDQRKESTPRAMLWENKYKRCQIVLDRLESAFNQIDEGVQFLGKAKEYATAGNDARSRFTGAESFLVAAQTMWRASTPDSCGESGRQMAHSILGTARTYAIETWIEKTKQLRGLAEQRAQDGRVTAAARILEEPRATVATAPGQLPPKYVDSAQFGCGSLAAWQKTVSKLSPAGDPNLLPGCAKLDDETEGGPSVQVVSQAKKRIMKLDELDHDRRNPKIIARDMKAAIEELTEELAKDVWKTPELDPMAQSFERLLVWMKNEMAAVATREDIYMQMHSFAGDYDEKSGKFKGKFYDVYAPAAQKCIDLVKQAQADGVDIETTSVVNSDNGERSVTYRAALDYCRGAKGGMAAKKKADQEAAAAEDLKWKTLCGGDKYALWKQRGQFALSRGGWDQSRPEEACKAAVWWAHYGPDNNQVYDCEKYTFSGNKQTQHVKKSNRWFMSCP